ncbi:hypothetical protein CesoFtcFv8_019289 [Champsocephalus esox]|uniref:Uncharacterized protein n=1 Tax=Champsocephalus esox TaxID=159716 RepID=A0AAN8GPH4_9TELE|nr:hypothetical protein CesoFtcFv8_019289 [Champsocephalus esox]
MNSPLHWTLPLPRTPSDIGESDIVLLPGFIEFFTFSDALRKNCCSVSPGGFKGFSSEISEGLPGVS